jgi:hypothetical protein
MQKRKLLPLDTFHQKLPEHHDDNIHEDHQPR